MDRHTQTGNQNPFHDNWLVTVEFGNRHHCAVNQNHQQDFHGQEVVEIFFHPALVLAHLLDDVLLDAEINNHPEQSGIRQNKLELAKIVRAQVTEQGTVRQKQKDQSNDP